MKHLKSTGMHALELSIVLSAAFFITNYFKLPPEMSPFLITIVLGSLAKFARVSDKVPMNDYVNPKDATE